MTPPAFDLVLSGVLSHIENGRVHFTVPSGELQSGQSRVPASFWLSEVYWNRIGCPVSYTSYQNVEG